MEGGQFYQYINVNLYQSKKSGNGFFVNPIDEYQFLTQSCLRYGDKIITKFTIFLFFGLLLAGVLCLIINIILSFFGSTPKINKTSQFLFTHGYKILRMVSFRYNTMFVFGLAFWIASLSNVDTGFHQAILIGILLSILFITSYFYYISISYMKCSHSENYPFLNALASPAEEKMNKTLHFDKLFDEFFVLLKSFSLYHLHKYKLALCIIAFVLTIAEFLGVIIYYKTIRKGITVVKIVGILLFALFVLVLIFGFFNIGMADAIF
jgi:hypothetical protein